MLLQTRADLLSQYQLFFPLYMHTCTGYKRIWHLAQAPRTIKVLQTSKQTVPYLYMKCRDFQCTKQQQENARHRYIHPSRCTMSPLCAALRGSLCSPHTGAYTYTPHNTLCPSYTPLVVYTPPQPSHPALYTPAKHHMYNTPTVDAAPLCPVPQPSLKSLHVISLNMMSLHHVPPCDIPHCNVPP